MNINVIYDQSQSSLPAGFVAAVNYVVNFYDTTFTNAVTVNIDLGYGEIAGQGLGAGALGESETYFDSFDYSTAVGALTGNEPSNTQKAAYSTLPGSSPLSGGTLWMSTAEEKALGLLEANNSAIDGYVGLSNTYPFSYPPGVTPAFGAYYFVGVLAHEFSEVMGRDSMLGEGLGGTNSYTIMDLFRYSAAGARQLSTGGPAYFSIDNGNTNLDSWNTDPNGDLGDWAASAGADAYLAFSPSGQVNSVSATDIELMNVLGWDTTPPALIVVSGTSAEALQGGSAVTLLSAPASITDGSSTTISSATIRIANGGGSAMVGDELYINGHQGGTVAGVTVSWNNSTKILTLTGTASIATYDTLLGELAYQDTGSDSSSGGHPQRIVTWTVNDGSSNLGTTSQILIDRPPVANNDTGADVVGTALSVSTAGGVLANDTDPDADTLSVTSVSETASGAGAVGQAIAGLYGHLTLNANGSYTYTADISSAIASAPTGIHLHDIFSYTAADGHGGTSNAATLNITLDRPPVVTASNVTLTQNTVVAASSLFSASNPDPDGDAITSYAFYDNSTMADSGEFLFNGVAQPKGTYQPLVVSAAQLSMVTFQAGISAGDDLYMAAYAGSVASNTVHIQVSVTAPPGTVAAPPIVTVSNITLLQNSTVAASSLFSVSNPVGAPPITSYAFYDDSKSASSGEFLLNGVPEPKGTYQPLIVSASQLSEVTFQAGTTGDDLYLAAYDGSVASNIGHFQVSIAAPVVTVSDVTLLQGSTVAASSLFSVANPVGASPITSYAFYNDSRSASSGEFLFNGVPEPKGTYQPLIVSAAQLSEVTFQAGTTGDDLYLAAYDGSVASNIGHFQVSIAAPVVTVSDVTLLQGSTVAASSLFSVTNPVGASPITSYAFYDDSRSARSGEFLFNGVPEPKGTYQPLIVSAAQLSEVTFQAGTTGDDLYLAAYDGSVASNIGHFQVSIAPSAQPTGQGSPADADGAPGSLNHTVLLLEQYMASGFGDSDFGPTNPVSDPKAAFQDQATFLAPTPLAHTQPA